MCFWEDARCRVAYEYFGKITTFDTTYLTVEVCLEISSDEEKEKMFCDFQES